MAPCTHPPQSTDFQHKRDDACRYWENARKHCRMSQHSVAFGGSEENRNRENGVGGEKGSGRPMLECQIIRQLLRRCPGKETEVVETIEEDKQESVNVRSQFGTDLFGKSDEQRSVHDDDGFFGSFDSGNLIDIPMDSFDKMMRRSMGRLFAGDEAQDPNFWPDRHGGFDRPSRGFFFGRPRQPPHHQHRYERDDEEDGYQDHGDAPSRTAKDRWGQYKSEDL